MDNDQLATDADWNDLKEVIKYQQQEYYELLAEWTQYNKDEYKYLKQNIGFALFGPPKRSTTSDQSETQMVQYYNSINDGSDVTDTLRYELQEQAIIDNIFQKIFDYGHGSFDAESIHYGVIFNVTHPIKSNSIKKNDICVQATPVFKIRLKSDTSQTSASTSQTWYIDMGGRVYKSWSDYKTCNTLPKCRMVLPKDGYYQPDRSYEITENSSSVWLEEADSPMCSTTTAVLSSIDIAANVAGVAGIALGIATLFTPAAPIVIGAAAACTGGTAVWNLGRSSCDLVDRSAHEESINPFVDRKAFVSWLSITGSTIGFAASGATTLLTTAVRGGAIVGTTAEVGYNVLVFGNLTINGFGVGYQAYCMYEEYQEEGQISTLSMLNLGAHVLFLGNSVINLQLAGNLIESTQGQVLNDYRNAIRSKRLRKQFNRVKRIAAANNSGKMYENAEVIRFINTKYKVWQQNNIIVPTSNTISFKNGVIKINDVALIDPMKFVSILLEADKYTRGTPSFENVDSFMDCALRSLLQNLLENFTESNIGTFVPIFDIDDYEDILMDLNHIQNAMDIFRVLFKLGIILLQNCRSPSDCLAKALHFLWYYVKENLKRRFSDVTILSNDPNAQALLQRIINFMFENADNVMQSMIPAFIKYLSKSR